MQRASAQSSPSTRSTNGPPAKRVRLSNGTASPATPSSTHEAVQAALAAEEEQRLHALEKHATGSGEMRWVLSVQEQPRENGGLNVVTAGFGDIDSLDLQVNGVDEEEDSSRATVGRRTFGKIKRPVTEDQDDSDSDASSGSSISGSEDDDGDPAAQLIRESRKEAAAEARAERKAKRKAQEAEQTRMAEERQRKEVRLNTLTSISGGGGISSGSSTPRKAFTCFTCGQAGHKKAECPNRRRAGGAQAM